MSRASRYWNDTMSALNQTGAAYEVEVVLKSGALLGPQPVDGTAEAVLLLAPTGEHPGVAIDWESIAAVKFHMV